jgi:hypothetical protein
VLTLAATLVVAAALAAPAAAYEVVTVADGGALAGVVGFATRSGVVRVVCDAHPHMLAWMIVHDSPYYAVTDERGAFRIDGILPGRCKVTMWHEGFRSRGLDSDGRPRYDEPPTVTRGVTIAPRATATIDFELK